MNYLRPREVENIFNSVAPNYDKLNDLFSFGLHRLWKKKLLTLLAPQTGERWIDLCCGTGDLSFELARIVIPNGIVVGVDSAKNQLLLAKQKALSKYYLPVEFHEGDALNTSLASGSFNGGVMAYGLRNLSNPLEGLRELFRLLTCEGRAGVLDFNPTPAKSASRIFQKLYLKKFVCPVAARFGLRQEYEYLQETLKTFPGGTVQEEMALEAGFHTANYKVIAAGQMGILLLKK